jgi:hypothetical protein
MAIVVFVIMAAVTFALVTAVNSFRGRAPGFADAYQDDDNAPTFRVGDQVIWTDPVSIDGYQDMEWADVISVVTYDGEVWIRTESGAVLHVNACDLELNYNPTTQGT